MSWIHIRNGVLDYFDLGNEDTAYSKVFWRHFEAFVYSDALVRIRNLVRMEGGALEVDRTVEREKIVKREQVVECAQIVAVLGPAEEFEQLK
jgi:hypothetical protein